ESVETTSLVLTWSPVPNAITYDIERDSIVIVTGHQSTSYQDTNLEHGTEYTYRVRGVNNVGPGEWSEPFVIMTPVAATTIASHTPETVNSNQAISCESSTIYGMTFKAKQTATPESVQLLLDNISANCNFRINIRTASSPSN